MRASNDDVSVGISFFTFCVFTIERDQRSTKLHSASHSPRLGRFFFFYCCSWRRQADNPERANACTTAFFEGNAAIMDPRESWAAKWIRVDNYLPGVYAISVTGTLDKEIEEDLGSRGLRWRCRPAPS